MVTPPGAGDQVGQQPGPHLGWSACCSTHPGLLGARPPKVEKPVGGWTGPMVAPFQEARLVEGGRFVLAVLGAQAQQEGPEPGTGLQDSEERPEAQQGPRWREAGVWGVTGCPLPSHSPGCEV